MPQNNPPYTSNVPLPTLGTTGFTSQTQSSILAGVIADMQAAFSGNLNFTTTSGSQTNSTPQGQLAASYTACIAAFQALFLQYIAGVDPAYSSGRMQDGIGRIYFMTRLPAQATVVQVQCNGASGVIIPVGAVVQDNSGNLYYCTAAAEIPIGGPVTTSFACTVTGPISCPAGAITTIYQTIPGWESVTNPEDGIPGTNVESPSAFEIRRAASVAANANNTLLAIQGAVLAVSGVTDCYTEENDSNNQVVIGGVTLTPNSLYVCVTGGEAQAVGQAIWSKKPPGCAYTGNTTVTVYDENSLYVPPYPSYEVTFQTSIALPIFFSVTIANTTLVPSNALSQIQTVILNAAAGGDGGAPMKIGNVVYASRYYAGVLGLGNWATTVQITIGSQNTASASFTGSISGTTLTIEAIGSGAIAVGQILTGASVVPGTTITAGGGSSWTVSNTQTVALESMYTLLANQSFVAPNIDQAPTTVAANIVLVLETT